MATGTPTISLNNVTYLQEDLAIGRIEPQSQFERNVLAFCGDWISGKSQFILSTSGSTGAPKKITIAREQMTASAQMTAKALGLRHGDNALICLDIQHIAGIMMLVRSFVTGMNMVVVEPCANPLAGIPNKVQIDFAAFVPYQLSTIIASQKEKLEAMRCVLVGGAPIDVQLKEKLKGIRCPLYATYGMTETISHIALQKLNGPDAQSHFQALPPIHLSTDERNCLVIKADYLPEEITTNDLVKLDGSKFQWLGRWDNVINSGGIKVVPEVLEQQLEKIFDLLIPRIRFFVTAIPDKEFGQKICLVIEGNEEDFPSVKKIRQDMQSALNPYHVPKEIKFITRFEETGSGKINRNKTINRMPYITD